VTAAYCFRRRHAREWNRLSFSKGLPMFRRFLCLSIMAAGVLVTGRACAQEVQQAALWPDLLQVDAAKAYAAMRRLAATPGATLAFLRDAVPPAKRTVNDKQVEDLIRQLDSDGFAERDKAQQELELLDWQAVSALRKALQASNTLELKRRLEQVISRSEGPPTGINLRWHRAVEVVEWIGTPDAKALLERWSQGAAASALTVEANKALKRSDACKCVDLPGKLPAVDAQGDPLPAGAVLRLGSTRWRLGSGGIGYQHGGVLFTNDSKKLIIAAGNAIGIMDPGSGKVVLQRAYNGHVSGIQLNPDGRRLFVSGAFYDGNDMRTPFLHVLDAADLKDIASWREDGDVEGFVDRGKQVILATAKGIRRLDAATGRELAAIPFGKGIEGKLYAFNGKLVVLANRRSRGLGLLDVSAPDKVRNLDAPDRDARSAALSADSKYLAIGGDYDYGVLIYDLTRGEPIHYLHAKNPRRDMILGLAFAPDGKSLALCSGNDTSALVLWDLETHQPRWKVPGHAGQLVFSPDGRFIAGNGAWCTQVWDAATGKELSASDESAVYENAAFSADGRSLLTVHSRLVRLLDFPSGRERMRISHPDVYRAALSPDGRRLATSAFNHDLRVWDAQSGRALSKLPDAGSQNGFAREFTFTSDSQRICTWEADCRTQVWDARSGRLLAEIRPRPEGFPNIDLDDAAPRRRGDLDDKLLHLGRAFCFSADGAQFLWHFNKLRVYDTATGKVLRSYDAELAASHFHPQISHDGEWLLLGHGGGTLFNLRHGKHRRLPWDSRTCGGAHSLAPDGRTLAVATSSNTKRRLVLIEMATLGPRLSIPLDYHDVHECTFSPDSRFLSVRLSDHSVVILDLRALGI
jgi:WD40 repeat protein